MPECCECKKLIVAENRLEEERWAAHKAVHILIETDINRRLSEMNELRKQLSDERGAYLTVNGYENKHEFLRSRLEELSRLVWIGVGIAIAASTAISFVIFSLHR